MKGPFDMLNLMERAIVMLGEVDNDEACDHAREQERNIKPNGKACT